MNINKLQIILAAGLIMKLEWLRFHYFRYKTILQNDVFVSFCSTLILIEKMDKTLSKGTLNSYSGGIYDMGGAVCADGYRNSSFYKMTSQKH